MAELAIAGGAPTFTGEFPPWPQIDDFDRAGLLTALDSGVWGIGGSCQEAFSKTWSQLTGARHTILTSAGSTALAAALIGCGIRPGDEVVTSAYTFQATATSLLLTGAIPVFADVEPGNFNLDPAAAEAAITPRTRAILPVHIAGGPANMDSFLEIGERRGLPIIEDACQAHGAAWDGMGVGSIGTAGAFSFQSSKNLPAGEGGAVTTNDDRVAEIAASVRNCGRGGSDGPDLSTAPIVGTNYRMTEFQASLLQTQMRRLPEQMALRELNAAYLDQRLGEIPGITPCTRDRRVTAHAYHLYMFRYDASAFGGASREQFVRALQAEGIYCHGGYQPLYKADFLSAAARLPGGASQDYPSLHLPVTEAVCRDAVWLTQRQLLGAEDVTTAIADAVEKIQRCHKELKA